MTLQALGNLAAAEIRLAAESADVFAATRRQMTERLRVADGIGLRRFRARQQQRGGECKKC
ncbi:MAG: hypothetical protein ACREB8_18345 [Pseudolabrys sp.]